MEYYVLGNSNQDIRVYSEQKSILGRDMEICHDQVGHPPQSGKTAVFVTVYFKKR